MSHSVDTGDRACAINRDGGGDSLVHTHRRPVPGDFAGKTVARFALDADNVWRIWFTDGSGFAIQAETTFEGIAYMEVCEACLHI